MDQDPRAQQEELNGVELVSKFSGSRLELLELLLQIANNESITIRDWWNIQDHGTNNVAGDIIQSRIYAHIDAEDMARREGVPAIKFVDFMRQELAELVKKERAVDEREAGLQSRIGAQAARTSQIDSLGESTEAIETKAAVESTRDLNRRIKAALGGSPRGGRRQNQGGSWKPRIG